MAADETTTPAGTTAATVEAASTEVATTTVVETLVEAPATATAEGATAPVATVEDAPIEANTDPLEEDEFELTEGWDAASNQSTSITSSIYRHTYEHGRRFHSYKYGRYPLPNDDIEQNREDMKHAMMLEITDGKLFYAPLQNAQKVLDVGTGTGIWAIEVADQMPSAEVLGIDLSPIQPKWLPPNCRFMIDDAEEEWLNGDNYDMVHMRTMASVMKDVPKALDSSFKALKPGGWIELQELEALCYCDDGTMPDDDELLQFYGLVHTALGRFGMDLKMPMKLRPLLEAAGFTNITSIVKKVPVGPWARDRILRVAGMYLREAIYDLIPAMTGKPFQSLGKSQAECEVMAMGVRKTLKDMSRHRYLPFYFWTAQKPE